MLRCLAGICGGFGGGAAKASNEEASSAAGPPDEPLVVKPIAPLNEEDTVGCVDFSQLVSQLGLILAPPDACQPSALVSSDYTRNCQRLLILVPSLDAPDGSWDVRAGDNRGAVLPILRWAEANAYAACLFSASALAAAPAETWDRVLRGSPASSVCVLTASGASSLLHSALAPMHPLLLTRYRLITTPFPGQSPTWPPQWPAELPEEVLAHIKAITLRAPESWSREEPKRSLQYLFEMLELRERRFRNHEARKYAGFQDLKENDMPGLKRMGADERIKRLDRDRAKDELAQLLDRNERGCDDGADEPGVD